MAPAAGGHSSERSVRHWVFAPMAMAACFIGRAQDLPRPKRPDTDDSLRLHRGASSPNSASSPTRSCQERMAPCGTPQAPATYKCQRDITSGFSRMSSSQHDGSGSPRKQPHSNCNLKLTASCLSQDLQSGGLHHYASSNLASDANLFDSFAPTLASHNSLELASCSPDTQVHKQPLDPESTDPDAKVAEAPRLHRLPPWAPQRASAHEPSDTLRLARRSQLDRDAGAQPGPGLGGQALSSPQLPTSRLSLDVPARGVDEAPPPEDRRMSLQLEAASWSSSCDGAWRPHSGSRASPLSPTSQQRQAAGAALASRAARYALVASQDRSLERLMEQMRKFKRQQAAAAELHKLELEASAQAPAQGQPWVSQDAWESDASVDLGDLGPDDLGPRWHHAPVAGHTLRHGLHGLTPISEADSGSGVMRDVEGIPEMS